MTPERAREIAHQELVKRIGENDCRSYYNSDGVFDGSASDVKMISERAILRACAEERAIRESSRYILTASDALLKRSESVALLQEIHDHYEDDSDYDVDENAKKWRGIMERVQDFLAEEKR